MCALIRAVFSSPLGNIAFGAVLTKNVCPVRREKPPGGLRTMAVLARHLPAVLLAIGLWASPAAAQTFTTLNDPSGTGHHALRHLGDEHRGKLYGLVRKRARVRLQRFHVHDAGRSGGGLWHRGHRHLGEQYRGKL